MELNFKINKYYLLFHAMKEEYFPFREWVNLQNKLWEISSDSYWFLFNPSMRDMIFAKIFTQSENDNNLDNFLDILKNDSKKIIAAAFKYEEFARLYKETEEYLKSLEKEWESKQEKIIMTTEEILGEKLPEIKINVIVTHPKLRNGITLPESNVICWGHSEDWENYSMVYLMHETLHLILDKKLGRGNLTHAIIELISDQELRVRLNNKGVYFQEAKENVGHTFLLKLEKALLPHWKKYLKSEDKNIKNFYEEMKNKPEIKKLLEHKQ